MRPMRSSLRAISPFVVLLVPVLMLVLAGVRSRAASGQAIPQLGMARQLRAANAPPTFSHRGARDVVETDAAQSSDAGSTDGSGTAADDAGAAPTEAAGSAAEEHHPRPVYVGIYPFHVPVIDLATNAYLVDFYMWFRWHGNDIDPSTTFEFMNLYEGWDMLRAPVYVDDAGAARPDPVGDGWMYQVFRIQARFTHPFDVHKYPFDDQQLIIEFEDTDATSDDMVYVADRDAALVDRGLEIPGWRIAGVRTQVTANLYPTNFGDTRRPVGLDRYSHFRYEIRLERPVLGYLVTTVLPVAIVMLITLMIFLINNRYFEGRLGLGITSLISAVALQLTAAGDLPKTGYLVLLDHIYNLSYLVIFLSLLESVFAVRLHDAGKEAAAKRLDRAALLGTTVLFFGGITVIILLR